MILEKLRTQTRRPHEELEQEMLPLIDRIHTVQDYADLLGIFRIYYGHLEQELQAFATAVLPDYGTRRKISWIEEDLRVIGSTPREVPVPGSFPRISDEAGAMGALYVMEGSTLGGKHISRMIGSALGLPGVSGLKFFAGYLDQNGSRWKYFLEQLARFEGSDGGEDLIKKANEVFAGFRTLLQNCKENADA